MLKVVLVEDSAEAMETVKDYLERYSEEKGLKYGFVWYSSPVKFLEQYVPADDIIFLDIQMPEMNGMDLAHRIREKSDEVPIVFITNMAQFAIKGYEVAASDFIVKPVSYFDFAMKFGRVLKKIEKSSDDMKITVSLGGDTSYIPVRDVRYVEVLKHKLKYFTTDGEFSSNGSLVKMQALLEPHDFVRCNNYCLVNLRYVFAVKGYTLTLTPDGKGEKPEIIISQPRKKEFMQKLNDYYRRQA